MKFPWIKVGVLMLLLGSVGGWPLALGGPMLLGFGTLAGAWWLGHLEPWD